jgi:BirA family biotin operon repressor/biotin-[acetyl-CoA-carboxylase] ligase
LISLLALDSVDSTQNEVATRLRAGVPVDAILAYEQTEGRGRFGRQWHSPKGECLALSFAWHAAIDTAWPEGIALAAGVLAAEVFDTSIAWPNDLLIDGKKVGGILCEIVSCPNGKVPVVGIGVNLTGEELPVPWATSLIREGRQSVTPGWAASALLGAIDSISPPQTFAAIEDRWRARDATTGKRFKVGEKMGTALEVLSDGSLRVDVHGEQVVVTSAEAIYGNGS